MNLAYYWLVRNADEKQKARIDARIDMPPAGVAEEAVGQWSADSEMAAFRGAARTPRR